MNTTEMLLKDINANVLAGIVGKSQTFSVSFVKANGEVREMNCRLGVTKHLRGGDSTTAHKPNILTVFEMTKQQYRNINTNTLLSLKAGGKMYTFK